MNINFFYRNPVIAGILGMVVIFTFYFTTLSLLNSPQHAISQFSIMWNWITALAVGFGIQVGLYAYVMGIQNPRPGTGNAKACMAASGGMSSAAMIGCCAHHATDILPLIGIAGLSTFLVQYQYELLMVGVASNIIGIAIMLNVIRTQMNVR